MLENRINPIRFFGILILAIPALLIGILFQEFRTQGFVIDSIKVWHIQVFFVMLFGLITSISLFLSWKYAKLLTNILLFFVLILFSFFLFQEVNEFRTRDIGSLLISLFVYLSITFCILFINNHFMQVYFKADFILKENESDDILDL